MALLDVIKYEGDPHVFAMKYPREDIGTWTQLIVHETQEAVLFKGGQALDVFGPGRHVLETKNIPLLSKIVNLPFGGRSPFTAEIWYVNKVQTLDVKWGTPSPIQLQDPKYNIFIPVRSYGQFGVQIVDSKKFVLKIVGTLTKFDQDTLLQYFRGVYLAMVKDEIATYISQRRISILEINAYIRELSEQIENNVKSVFDEYGIRLNHFYINDINIPDDDKNVEKLKAALSKRAEMDIVGYNYTQQRSFDTLEGMAKNKGTMQSGLMGAGVGLGMGFGAGGAVTNQFSGLMKNLDTNTHTIQCQKCKGINNADQKFCSHCGVLLHPKEATVEPEQVAKVLCSNCQSELDPKNKFCPNCGNPYNPCPYCQTDNRIGASNCDKCGKALPSTCENCGASVQPGDKFCHMCGQSMIKTCSNCNTVLEGNPKFCPECGTKLQ